MKILRSLTLLAALCCGLAHASTIYWYTGNTFQMAMNNGGDWASTSQSITAWFSVASPLAANSLLNITPLDWWISDGVHTLDRANQDVDTFALTVFTDANAHFSFWTFLASASASGEGGLLRTTMSTSSGQDLSSGMFSHGVSTAINSGNPGTWSSATVPEPGSLAYVCIAGLMMFALSRRKARATCREFTRNLR